MWDVLDGRSLTAEALARAAVVVAVEVLLLGTSFLNICVIFTTADLYDVIGCYLVSARFQYLQNIVHCYGCSPSLPLFTSVQVWGLGSIVYPLQRW